MFSRYTLSYVKGNILTLSNKQLLLSCFKITANNKVVDLNNYVKVSTYEGKIHVYDSSKIKYINEIKEIKIGTTDFESKLSRTCINHINNYFYNKYYDDINRMVEASKGMTSGEVDYINRRLGYIHNIISNDVDTTIEDIDLNKEFNNSNFDLINSIKNKVIEYALTDNKEELVVFENGIIRLSDDAYNKYIVNNEKIPMLKSERVRKSVNRSYNTVDNLAKANAGAFNYFLTLTFADGDMDSKYKELNSNRKLGDYDIQFKYINDPKDIKEGSLIINKFFTGLKYHLKKSGKELKYLGVPEYQKNGNIHYHFLVSDIPEELIYKIPSWLDYDNTSKSYNHGDGIKTWVYGKSDVSKIKDKARITSYIEKYLVKDIDEHIDNYDLRLNKKRYYKSNNLIKPKINYNQDIDDYSVVSVYDKVKLNTFNNTIITESTIQINEIK